MIIRIEKKIRIRLLLWLYFPIPPLSLTIPSNIPRFILSSTFFYIIFIISILISSFILISIISFSLPNLAFLIAISSLIHISFRLPIKCLTCTSCTRANLSFFNSSIIRRTTSCY
nr:MAG TPA: hypothetical protein [Crassvirales sp.]